MKTTEVSAAILRRNGKILICKRKGGGSCAHLWEFPGGKRNPEENWEDCLVRECQEELDVEIRVLSVRETVFQEYPDIAVRIRFFETKLSRGEPRALVHEEIRWVAPSSLPDFAFCPADGDLIRKLAEE